MQKWRPTPEYLPGYLAMWKRIKDKAEREEQFGMLRLAQDWIEFLETLHEEYDTQAKEIKTL